MKTNPLEAYGTWIATVEDEWSTHAVDLAYRQLIDTLAGMIPGAVTPVVRKISAEIHPWSRGDSTVVGSEQPLALPWAVMVNATAGHALDFDDNFDPAKAHLSTVVWPVILGVAEHYMLTPRQCFDAYIVALQVAGRIGQGVNPPHRKRGWHATATIGALGAAAAVARLLHLDPTEAAMALSLATSRAGGFMSQFGTMAKPLHAGNAAQGGLLSALFARRGVNAGWHTLDGPIGMNTLMVGPDRDALRAAIGEPEHGQTLTFETEKIGEPLLIVEHRFRVKRFPTCGSAHRSLDATQMLIEAHDPDPADIERVDVHAPAMHLKNLMYDRPRKALEGKFSIEYPLACLLLERRCGLADFTDQAVNRSSHQAFMERIHRHPIDRPETEVDTTIRITLRNGTTVEQSVFMPLGSKAAPYPTEQYWRKFDECTQPLMAAGAHRRLRGALEQFERLPLARDLVQCLGVTLEPLGAEGPV